MSLEQKLLKKVQRMTLEQKIDFLQYLLEKDRLEFKEGYINNFNEIMSITEQMYPDKWDLDFDIHPKNLKRENPEFVKLLFSATIIIKFDKLTVTNSKGLRKNIYDLYVRFEPEMTIKEQITFQHFNCIRMGATKEDISSGYIHSHISQKVHNTYASLENFRFKNTVCLGYGAMSNIVVKMKVNYTENNYRMFLIAIEQYFQWESLSGRPYHYIKNVNGKGALRDIVRDDLISFYDFLVSKKPDLNTLNIEIRNNSVLIKDDENLENFLKINGDNPLDYKANIIVERDEKGENYAYRSFPKKFSTSLLLSEKDREKIDFYFRGEKVDFRIVEEEELNNRMFYIHPKIKYYVKRKIEQKTQTKRLRKSVFGKQNLSKNSKRSTEKNTISM